MWKNLLGISLVVGSIALLVDSISSAKASLGPMVSSASNPIFSGSNYCSGNSSITITGQSGQEIIVTDVNISAQTNGQIEIVFTSLATGVEIGRYKTWNNSSSYTGSAIIDTHLNSGLRVPANEDLLVSVNGNGSYTFSGYYAHQ
jgi:hypothetical protein